MRGSLLALALWGILAAPALADGQLAVESRPAGAQIALDGWAMGRTPLVIHVLPGRHRLIARLAGRTPRIEVVRVPNGLTLRRLIVLPQPHLAVRRTAHATQTPARPVSLHSHHAAPHPRVAHPGVRVAERPAPIRRPASRVVPTPPAPRVKAPAPFPWRWCVPGVMLAIALLGLILWRRPRARPPVWYAARPARGVLDGPAPGEAETTLRSWLADGEPSLAAAGFWSLLGERRGASWHYYHLGLALHLTGRTYEAETAYRTALQFDPTCAAGAYNLGVLLVEAGQPERALLAYRRLLDAHPLSIDGWFNLGHVYYQLHMAEQARAAWLEARAIAPRDAAVRQNLKMLPAPFARGRHQAGRGAIGSDRACV